ncbi:MAG TPA: hypothetical protein VMY77_14500 [Chitinophagaceae bacterium]|nr:hypothetical protein [Chitinophagaceae bacterium]
MTTSKFIQLANHIIAMEKDAHFIEHPEWNEIVKDAKAALESYNSEEDEETEIPLEFQNSKTV